MNDGARQAPRSRREYRVRWRLSGHDESRTFASRRAAERFADRLGENGSRRLDLVRIDERTVSAWREVAS